MKKNLLSTPSNAFTSFHKFIAVVLLSIVGAFSANAQVANYAYSETAVGQAYALPLGTVSATGTVVSGTISNITPVLVPIGFTFNFNGVNYTNTSVSDNGFITFGGTAPGSGYLTPISVNSSYNGAIACFGQDLRNASQSGSYLGLTSDVTYTTIDPDNDLSTPNNIFVVQYRNMIRRTGVPIPLGLLNMQIRLYQSTNVVETLYDAVPTFPVIALLNGQLGLRGANNLDYNNRRVGTVTNDWVPTLNGTAVTDIMPLGPSNYPATVTKCTWTPPCPVVTALSATTAVNSVVTWTAPLVPVAGYVYEVRFNGTAYGSGATGRFSSGSLTSPTTTFTAVGLAQGVTYTIFVQSACLGAVVSTTVTPPCTIATIPYSQNFEMATLPLVPPCTSKVESGTTLVTVDRSVIPRGGFTNRNLVTVGNLLSNSWFFTQLISFPSTGYYKLSYKYGGSSTSATQKMKVSFGTTNSEAGMTTLIADHNNIKTTPLTNTVNFYAVAGSYFVGFNAYANATQGTLQLDDILLETTTCVFPVALTSSQVGATTANISWTAPAPAPAGGYEYYVAPSATPPSSTTPPTGVTAAGVLLTSLTGLLSSTTYNFWVRSVCGGGDISAWTLLSGTFTTSYQAPLSCTITTAPSVGTTFFNNVTTTGATANINNSSGFSVGGYGDYTNVVLSHFQGGTVNFTTGISGPTVGVAIWVDWNNNGIFETTERVFNTTAFVSTLSGVITVPGAQVNGEFRMRLLMDFFNSNPTNPCTLSNGATGRGEVEDYTFKVVSPPPALTLSSSSSTQCASVNSPLVTITAGLAEYSSFSWSPATGVSGTSGAGYTFNSTSTVNYTLTASQTVSPFNVRTTTFTYNANALPTALVITPTSSTICGVAAAAVQLVATGGIVAGAALLSENFNSGAPGWTTNASSTGGIPANANWTIRNSGYAPGGSSGIPSVVSNDNSQFYISNSDSQGAAGTTNVQLISPSFSLLGYSDASLNYYHHVRPFNTNYYARVEIFSGGSWTTLQSWIFANGPQGTATNFALASINLTSYVGQSGLQIRFNYYDLWGYVWAVDNVLITGTASAPVVIWTPNGAGSGLFTDAGATAVYGGTNTPSIFAKPTTTAGPNIYTATVTTPQGCSTSNTATINYRPISMGTTSANQTVSVCSGLVITNITVSAFTGTSIFWEYTDDPLLLTGWTTIPSSNAITLTVAQIGSLANTRYFRAVATNLTCILRSSVVTVTIINSVTWNGTSWSNTVGPDSTLSAIFAGNYNSTADLNACSVSVVSGTVRFNGPHTLRVQRAVQVNTPGSLLFEDSASLVQDVTNDGNGLPILNSGNITYKRNSTPCFLYDYTYWSSPVAAQTLIGLSPSTSTTGFFDYNPSISFWQQSNNALPMTIGKGYLIRVPSSFPVSPASAINFTATFSGVPNTGTIPLSVVNNVPSQLNLIGNPYPSAISAAALVTDSANSHFLGGTIYLWTHNSNLNLATGQYNFNDYALWNITGGTGTYAAPNTGAGNVSVPSGNIAAGQGFFIKTVATGTAFFRNSMRLGGASNSNFFRSSMPSNQSENTVPNITDAFEKHRIWLDISNGGQAYKQLLVGYIQEGTDGLDRLFDGEMVDNGNEVALYTTVENTKLSIQGRGLTFSADDVFSLGFKTTVANTYTINLSNYDGLFTTQNIYLEDKLLNVMHNVKDSPYTFSSAIGTFEDRFELRFASGSLGVPVFSENTVVVYKNEGGLHINTGSVPMRSVAIFDVTGRLIATQKEVGAVATVFTNLPTTQQILLVKIEGNDGKVVTKKIVF